MYKKILEEECKQYSKFETLEDFNENCKYWSKSLKKVLTRGEYIAFKVLRNRCAKTVGVAGVKLAVVIKDAIKKMGGMCPSRSTFESMLRKVKKLGVLTVVNRKQKDMHGNVKNSLQGHNIYVFEVCPEYEQLKYRNSEQFKHRETADEPNNDAAFSDNFKDDASNINSSSLKSLKDINVSKTLSKELNSDYVSNKVPSFITNLLKPFYDSKKVIEESYYNASNIINKYNLENEANEILKEATISLAQRTKKDKKLLNSPVGYFTNTVKCIVDKLEQKKQSLVDEMIELSMKLKTNANSETNTLNSVVQPTYYISEDTKATREELDALVVY